MGSGGGLLSEERPTVPSPSSPSSFSGGWSTGLKIPSFQPWVLPSDHQHPSRSPAQVPSTEQKTVLSVRKPLGLEEPCAGDWGTFAAISHFYQRAQRCRADEDGDCLWNNTSWSQAASWDTSRPQPSSLQGFPQLLGPPVPLPHKLLVPGDSLAVPMRTVTWGHPHAVNQHEVVSSQGSTWMADTFPLPGR